MLVRLVVLAALLSVASSAHASECEFPRYPVVVPAHEATDVPTNSKIWVSFDDWNVQDVLLLGPPGVEIEMTGETMDFGAPGGGRTTLTIWTPTAELAPDTEYEVWPCPDPYCAPSVSTFRTGAGPMSVVPPVPEVISSSGERRDLCKSPTLRLNVEFAGILVVDYAEDDPHAAKHADDGLVVSQDGDLVFLGPRSDAVDLRLGAYGLDGSFSGWSEPVTVALGGCAIADDSRLSGLLGLLVFAGRRRRSRRAGSAAAAAVELAPRGRAVPRQQS